MTPKHINRVLDLYETHIDVLSPVSRDVFYRMIPMIREFLRLGGTDNREKAMRWLGFMQGVLWSEEVFTIDELRSHNRTDRTEEERHDPLRTTH